MLAAVLLSGLASCSDKFSDPEIPVPEGGRVGTGEWDNPMTAYQASIGSVNYTVAEPWVTGYIVGYIDTNISNALSEKTAVFGSGDVATNMLIATTPDETDWEKCATVQLPSGAVRNALNVSDHPENIGKLVTIKGTTGDKYCSAYGVKNVSNYTWTDQGIPEGETIEVPAVGEFYQDFLSGVDMASYQTRGWSNDIESGKFAGWVIASTGADNYVSIDAFEGFSLGGPYVATLLTPAIDLAQLSKKTVEFDTRAGFHNKWSRLQVFVRVLGERDEDGKYHDWEDVYVNPTIAEAPADKFGEWISSGVIDLSHFSGEVKIGWRYTAQDGGYLKSTTYCLDNINVGGMKAPANWTGAELVWTGLDPNSDTCDWTFDNVDMPSNMTRIFLWTSYSGAYYLNASAYMGGTNYAATAYAISPVVDLTGYTAAKVDFEHAAKFQTTLPSLGRLCVREAGTTTWTEYSIPQWPAAGSWAFANSGDIDISDFAGKKVEVALKYQSTSEGADQWEVRSLNVSGVK